MRDYKQMQEIERLRQEASSAPTDDTPEPERERYNYSHRSPGAKGWLEYIKEYYKWPILIIALSVIGVLFGINQCRANSDPDLSVMYIGPYGLPAVELNRLESTVASLAGENGGDFNGDGDFRFSFLDLPVAVLTDADGKKYIHDDQTAYTRFQTELRAGDAMLYFFEPNYYERAKKEGVLQELKEIGVPEELSFDGYGIYLGNLDCYALDGLSYLPPTTVVCMRRSPENDEITYGRTVEDWQSHRDLFLRLVDYTDPQKKSYRPTEDPKCTLLYIGSQPMIDSYACTVQTVLDGLLKEEGSAIRSVQRVGSTNRQDLIAKQIRTELKTGDSFVWILDPEAFRYAKEQKLLAELPAKYTSPGVEANVDGYGLRLSKLGLYAEDGFCELEGETILCLRRSPSDESESYGRTEASYEIAKEIFALLAEYKK